MTKTGFSSNDVPKGIWDSADALLVDGGKTPVWKCSKCGTLIYGSDIGMTFMLGAAGRLTNIHCPNRDCRHIDKIGEVRTYGKSWDKVGFACTQEYSEKVQTFKLKEKFRKLFKRWI